MKVKIARINCLEKKAYNDKDNDSRLDTFSFAILASWNSCSILLFTSIASPSFAVPLTLWLRALKKLAEYLWQ